MALKIIGAGLGRTGTLSLKFALEHLGFGPCCHAIELMSSLRQQLPKWLTVFGGSPDWDKVYEGFVSAVDYPTCRYWRELAAYYPDAKVILSTRDAQGWFDSMNRTVLSAESVEKINNNPVSALLRGMQSDLGQSPIAAAFGGDGPGSSEVQPSDRQAIIDYFEQWETDVMDSLPSERLLVYRPGDGWEPLCAFLGVPVPAEPFPRINTSEDMMEDGLAGGDASTFEAIEATARDYLDQMHSRTFAD